MLSYIDVFTFLAVLAAVAVPFTLLLRTIKPGGQNAGH